MKGLTPKQHEVLDFIHQYIGEHNFSPSYREMMKHFSFSSPGTVYKYIQILIKKGALEAEKYSHRSLFPISLKENTNKRNEIELPFIGNLVCGYPMELFLKHQIITVPAYMINDMDKTYILQVQGNTLKEDAILDRDYILIESREKILDGDIILGLINKHDTVLKRYFYEDPLVRLENLYTKNHPLMLKEDIIFIYGVMIGMLRLY